MLGTFFNSNSHQPFRTLYSMGFREPGLVDFSFPAAGNRPESSPHFHSEVQHRPFPQRGRSPSEGNGRKAWFPAPGDRGSGPGTAVVPSVWSLSGLSGRRNASAGAGRVRPGAGRAQPDRSPDGRGGGILSTPPGGGGGGGGRAGGPRQGGRTRWNTSAGVR